MSDDLTLYLPVAEVESSVTDCTDKTVKVCIRVRLKGQRPENKCLIEFTSDPKLVETIHEAKKRDGTVWVRFKVDKKGENKSQTLTVEKLVVRDLLE